MTDIPQIYLDADRIGLRLETVAGTPTWEAWPSYRHQKAVQAIERSLKHGNPDYRCACLAIADIYIRFPDGSFKRPDLAIYCEEPPEDEQDGAVTLLPAAVVEILSPGYERKDLDAIPWYRSHGIADVLVYDPRERSGVHAHAGGRDPFQSPWQVALSCGCMLSF